MAIRWAAHRASGSQAGSDGAPWLVGKAAGAVACDATLIPVVTGQVGPAALDELVGLCLQFAGHGPHCGLPQPAAPAAQPGQTTAQPGQKATQPGQPGAAGTAGGPDPACEPAQPADRAAPRRRH